MVAITSLVLQMRKPRHVKSGHAQGHALAEGKTRSQFQSGCNPCSGPWHDLVSSFRSACMQCRTPILRTCPA